MQFAARSVEEAAGAGSMVASLMSAGEDWYCQQWTKSCVHFDP